MTRAIKFPEDHMRLVQSIAWSFHFTTGLPFEDLYSEACLQYCRSKRAFNRSKEAKFTTYLTARVNKQLVDYAKRENRILFSSLESASEKGQTPVYEYWEWYKPDVQTLVDMVRNSNGEISGVPPKMARGVIYRGLREQGWSWPRIWDALRETKRTLNEMQIGSII